MPSLSSLMSSNGNGGRSPNTSWSWEPFLPMSSPSTVSILLYPVSSCTYLVVFILSLPPDGWTGLPNPRGWSGIGSRQSSCMGCHKGICWDDTQHLCWFASDGFTLDGLQFLPCGTTYHLGCICVGEPFCSQLPANRGLTYPWLHVTLLFICEACTVHAQLGMELNKSTKNGVC